MIVVVLGMHKSGTSLVAETLHASGIDMGDGFAELDYDRGNKTERLVTQEANMRLLRGHLLSPPRDQLKKLRGRRNQAGHRVNSDSTVCLVRADALGRRLASLQTHRELSEVVDRLSERYEHWGFKDPRSCLTYPAWEAVLPPHSVVVVYRDPRSLQRRVGGAGRRKAAAVARLLANWLLYNSKIIDIVRSRPSALMLDYDALMGSQAEFNRLEQHIGRPLVDVRAPELYRNRADESSGGLPEELRSTWADLCELRDLQLVADAR